jgi:DNA modification methylase
MTSTNNLKIAYQSTESLFPNTRNSRTHSKKQVKQLAESIMEFGFNNPVLIDSNKTIIAGHGRVMAAKKLGLESVPTISVEHLSPEQIRAYMIADNQLGLNSEWDMELLSKEIADLSNLNMDFDLEVTGFETAEIDKFIADADRFVNEEFDKVEQDSSLSTEDNIVPKFSDEYTPVSIEGDIWFLGKHKIICADSRAEESYAQLFLGGQLAQAIFTDPPYNVPIDGHVCGKGSNKHNEFAMAAGEMTAPEFTEFLATVFKNQVKFSTNGSINFVCMDWRHLGELLSAAEGVFTEYKNLCVWNKNNAGMGTFYRSKHELVGVFKSGTAPHINNFELGQNGRYRTNIWNYRGVNSFGADRDESKLHPTVKPVELIADAILDCSTRDSIVLDPFLGSGSTLIAAEKTGRICYGIELDRIYIDTIINRWQDYTGQTAIHSSGASFEDIKSERRV